MRQARAQSSVELLGRKTLDSAGDQEAAERLLVSPADPAARILEALLYEADQAARFAMLPDVFTPPDPQQQVPCQPPALHVLYRTTHAVGTIWLEL